MTARSRVARRVPGILLVLLLPAAGAMPQDNATRPKEFKDGVIAFDRGQYPKAVKSMERALRRQPNQDGAMVFVSDLLGQAPYVPGYYWAAAMLSLEPTFETCVEARQRWAPIIDQIDMLVGPPEVKNRIKAHLDLLRHRCDEYEADRRVDLVPAAGEARRAAAPGGDPSAEPAGSSTAGAPPGHPRRD